MIKLPITEPFSTDNATGRKIYNKEDAVVSTGNNDGNLLIKIEGSLSAYEVAAFRDQMLLGFENQNGVTLDIDGITDCDTLGVQLFCSAGKTARLKNKNFSILGRSEACRAVALNIGLDLEAYLSS